MGRPRLWVRLQPNGMTEVIGVPLHGGVLRERYLSVTPGVT